MTGSKNDTFNKTVNSQAIVTKLSIFVNLVYGNLHSKFGTERTTFDKVIAKKLKIPMESMDLSSRTRAWQPSVLILRGLCRQQTMSKVSFKHDQGSGG
jgi:hypothetical protein